MTGARQTAMQSDLAYVRARQAGAIRSAGADTAPTPMIARKYTIERRGERPWSYETTGDTALGTIATTCALSLVDVRAVLWALPVTSGAGAEFTTRGGATLIVRRTR